MAIQIDGSGNVTTPGHTGEDQNITLRYGVVVVGNQPTYQQPTGVVTVATNPAVQFGAPIASKFAIGSFNSYVPQSAPTQVGNNGYHAQFFTGPSTGYSVPGSFSAPWPGAVGSGAGSITSAPSSVFYNTSSDYRLKENITPIENGLDYIMPLRPRRFNWKDSHTQVVGFIAHEIQEDAPPFLASTVVAGEKDGKNIFVNLYKNGELMLDDFGNAIERIIPTDVEIDMLKLEGVTWTIVREEIINQSIDTNGFISPLVASIQELKHMTDSQKQKINSLKSRIKILEEAF